MPAGWAITVRSPSNGDLINAISGDADPVSLDELTAAARSLAQAFPLARFLITINHHRHGYVVIPARSGPKALRALDEFATKGIPA